jgi:hypothetical protein
MKKKPLYCPFYVGQPTEKEREALFRQKQQADAERKGATKGGSLTES